MFEGTFGEWINVTDQNRIAKINRFVELSRDISLQMNVRLAHDWPDLELSMPQFKALTHFAGGRLRMGDIARLLGISLSSATNLVDRLERKGLVRRDHDREDRRVVTCDLTEDGRATLSRFWEVGRGQVEELTSHLTEDELDLVLHALELLARSWERASVPNRADSHPPPERAS